MGQAYIPDAGNWREQITELLRKCVADNPDKQGRFFELFDAAIETARREGVNESLAVVRGFTALNGDDSLRHVESAMLTLRGLPVRGGTA